MFQSQFPLTVQHAVRLVRVRFVTVVAIQLDATNDFVMGASAMEDCEGVTVYVNPKKSDSQQMQDDSDEVVSYVSKDVSKEQRVFHLQLMHKRLQKEGATVQYIQAGRPFRHSYGGVHVDMQPSKNPVLCVYGKFVDCRKLLPVGPCDLAIVSDTEISFD